MLELRTHETIPISRALQYHEMNLEHPHVEENRDGNEAYSSRHEMAHKKFWGDPEIAE
jgi:hypothetical protein